jgi:hypothetical protein
VISDSAPRLAADVRTAPECLRDGEEPSTGLPARFLETFSPQQVAALSEYVDGTALPILRWRPRIGRSSRWRSRSHASGMRRMSRIDTAQGTRRICRPYTRGV